MLSLFSSFVLYGIDVYVPSPNVGFNLVYIGYFLFATNLLIYYFACTEQPGIITSRNYDDINNKYKNLNVFYAQGGNCRTCKYKK